MTISSTENKKQYTGDGATVEFSFPYLFIASSHLKVIETNLTTLVDTTAVEDTDYTVSGAGDAAGGKVTYTTAPDSNTRITIIREVPIIQETDYLENDPFAAETHEQALDILTMIAQQLESQFGRTLKLKDTTTLSGIEVPNPGAGKFFRWNAAGDNVDLADNIEGTSNPMLAAEDLIVGGAAGVPTRLVTGGADEVLKISASAVAWGKILTANITDLNVTTAKLAANAVTFAKMQQLNDLRVLGNVSGALADPAEVSILDEDTMSSDSATALATQQSIKAYADSNAKDWGVKAWINFNGTGTIAIRDSFNVTSIVDNGTGDYTVNWATDFANVNYTLVGMAGKNTGANSFVGEIYGGRAVGSAQVATWDGANTQFDAPAVMVMSIGDQ